MAATLKYWRESASLIIASRRLAPILNSQSVQSSKKQNFLGSLFGKKDQKNESAETAPGEDPNNDEEVLRLLMMKRSAQSSFMPNAYVFPGGKLDDSDFSKDWLDVFCYHTKDELLDLFTHSKPGSPIYSRGRELKYSLVPSELALRLAAIRETFEESGVLLARTKASMESSDTLSITEPSPGCVADVPYKTGLEWRKKIVSDPTEFFNFCQELEVVPDIWSLYEWSNWLTPTFRGQRFDTAFFISCIDEAPPPVDDKSEMVHGMWTSPSASLNAYVHNMINLSPPQLYELSRLIRFKSVDDLLTLAWKRASYRSQRWMAVLMTCKDGLVFLLPGDDLYPTEPDEEGVSKEKLHRTETFAELCEAYPTHHRAFLSHEYKQFQLYCNLKYVDGHILPQPYHRPEVKVSW